MDGLTATLFQSSRLPVILQAEAAECGVACLAMTASYHGHRTSLAELRRRFSVSLQGSTLNSIMDMADGLGLSSRPLRVELQEIAKLKRPAILHWDLKHFVVLSDVSSERVVIHDPARGRISLSLAEVSRRFSGVALELTPTPAFQRKPAAERVRLSDFFGRVTGARRAILQLFALAAIAQLFATFSPMLNQLVIDGAVSRADVDLLTTVGIGMAVLLTINAAIALLRGYIGLYLGTQLSFHLQTNLLRHTLRLPATWFEKRHVGDILSRFGSLTPVQTVFSSSAISLALDLVMALAAVVMMLLYSHLLTGLEALALVLSLAVQAATFPYVRSKTDQALHLASRVQTTFLETIRGARTFKLFGRERERVALWQNEQTEVINNGVELARFNLWGGAGATLLNGAQQIVIWYLGARMVIEGQLTLGMLIAYQAYAAQFVTSTNSVLGQVFTLRALGLHLERLADIVHAEPEAGADVAPRDCGAPFHGGLALRGASFRYAEHEPWIIRNASLSIAAGEFACFIGPSGQGKTTLLKMLVGFNPPQEGQLLLDGSPIQVIGVRTLRQHIGVVMQDDQLFRGTIADNISFFDPTPDGGRVEAAARLAQVHEEIAKLPMAYATLVGDLGSTLSGGQRQRVLLARALYRQPKILFLDEGTANLDPENENRVMEVIRSLPITRIVIAHRPAAREGADRIFLVESGAVTEQSRAQGRRIQARLTT